ncbi:hypothetical protein ACP4OV_008102 [Aristida adscensionis]
MEATPATAQPQMEPGAASSHSPSPPPAPSPPRRTHATCSSPPPAPSPPRRTHATCSSPPPAPSPPRRTHATCSSPPPAPSPPRGEGERRAADPACPGRCVAGEDRNRAPPSSPASAALPQPKGEDVAASGEVAQLEEEVVAGAGKALRSFMEGKDSLLQEKYISLLEKYRQQEAKCAQEYNGLKKKYTDECSVRRRLYNELIELRGNIRVFCRCRPLSADEVTCGCSSVIETEPCQDTELQFISSGKEKRMFKFDRVFGPGDNQETVFSETAPVVRSAMDGYNVCIFAYGQTGTGKTFTMEGVPENRGVNYRALEELFRMSEERSSSVTYKFSVSILEVYNEKIRDLLDESNDKETKRLDIKQSADGTQEVPGLVESPVYTIDDVWGKLKVGARNRSVASTCANELSSRSHSLVRVTVRSEHLVTGQRSKSQIWLVDLAGSERVAKTEAEGYRLKESQFINKSLSALGDVISALASKSYHIPYRNSKLTHLLQSSLGGDCKTIMFVQISPSSTDSGETLCSLNFASRVRAVEHGPARKQVDPTESLKLKQLTEELHRKEKENANLNSILQIEKLRYACRENSVKTLNEKVRKLERELANEKAATRETARSSRPPLAPMRQRPTVGRNTNQVPPLGAPPKSRLGKAPATQSKENIPVMYKAPRGADFSNAVGKARRVSLTPMIRQIPHQPKRRSSMAILPTQREQLVPERRAETWLPQLQVPRRSSIATFNSFGTPLGAPRVPVTPDDRGGKFKSSSSKFTSPPMLAMWNSRNNMSSSHQKLGMLPGSTNTSKLYFSIQKRVTLGSPARIKTGMPSSAGIFNPALREKMVVGRSGNAVRVFINPKRRQSIL